MRVERCTSGHFFDGEKFASCPICAKEGVREPICSNSGSDTGFVQGQSGFNQYIPVFSDDQRTGITVAHFRPNPTGQLVSPAPKTPYIVRNKTGMIYDINVSPFRIGRLPDNNCVIDDNTAISRNHAVITLRGDCNIIMDQRSANHTFVNGKMLQSGGTSLINDGDSITLANEDFVFHLR